MIGMTEDERLALHLALRSFAKIMEEIGWEKRLADLSETEALALMETAIDAFQEAMASTHKPAASEEIPF